MAGADHWRGADPTSRARGLNLALAGGASEVVYATSESLRTCITALAWRSIPIAGPGNSQPCAEARPGDGDEPWLD